MSTLFKIKYRVVEFGMTHEGVRISSDSIGVLSEVFKRKFYDHTLIYMELLEVIEKNDELVVSISTQSLIIMPWLISADAYDSFLP
jgi:hypothetical protein